MYFCAFPIIIQLIRSYIGANLLTYVISIRFWRPLVSKYFMLTCSLFDNRDERHPTTIFFLWMMRKSSS